MNENDFPSLDINHAQQELVKLYDRVASSRGRVELTKSDRPDDACIIISKRELESLERALQILSDTDEVKTLAHAISHACDVCNVQHIAAP
jgi:PHD/YefM family antitoxin component YafN of YafNO toxin-antitoxin module